MSTRIFENPDPKALLQAARMIQEGGLVVFPTETVYGLGADAGQSPAVARIFRAKGRPQDNPLILHLPDLDAVLNRCQGMNQACLALARAFWPGPLTLILPVFSGLAPEVSAGLSTVGVRVPQDGLARDFLRACGRPVAAPSANLSGQPSPTSPAMALEAMNGRVDGIILGDDCRIGLESAILWIPDSPGMARGDFAIHLLRAGSISPIRILDVCREAGLGSPTLWYQGQVLGTQNRFSPGPAQDPALGMGQAALAELPRSPGSRHPHYAPRCRVLPFVDPQAARAILAEQGGKRTGLILLEASQADLGILSEQFSLVFLLVCKTLEDFGHRLYQGFREADLAGCQELVVQLPEGNGDFATALRDRILRASGQVH